VSVPSPTSTPTPTTEVAPSEPGACPSTPRHRPGVVPDGWSPELQPGAGGGAEIGSAVGHWAGPDRGAHVTLLRGTSPYGILPEAARPLRVLGREARIAPIHEGTAVEYSAFDPRTAMPCELTLLGYGISDADLAALAESLYVVDVADRPTFQPAIWPEDSAEEAAVAVERLVRGEDPWREDAHATALRFAADVLGWNDAAVTDSEPTEDGSFGANVVLAREPGGPTVEVRVHRAVADRWNSVTYLWGFPDETDHPASASIQGREVGIGFGFEGGTSAELRLGHGEHELVESAPTPRWQLTLDYDPVQTGSVMVLFRDQDGRVFAGWGTTLPAGDFAAG
jgi:hypothetical protein